MGDTYYDPKVVKQTLDEDGIAANDAKISDYGGYASGIMEGYFIFIIGDTVPFPSVPDWFRNFTNSLLRAKFWLEENSNKTLWDSAIQDIETFRTNFYEQPAAKTRRV